jgi:predicted regulator of Ras-like GTPase activity (Roadblock/LC7/MglB family)
MDQSNWDGFTNLRIGITIYPSHEKAIDLVISELEERCPAQFILLSDISGQLISARGDRGTADLTALSSLIAGDLAASQEIAHMTGQYQTCQLILREGQKSNSFIAEAGRYLVLFVQVSADVPLGWARILIRETSRQLADIVAATPEATQELDLGLSDENLVNAVDDALDSMWTA